MSVLQSPRVKDGSQNMEVSEFVVDMTSKSSHRDLHGCNMSLSLVYVLVFNFFST